MRLLPHLCGLAAVVAPAAARAADTADLGGVVVDAIKNEPIAEAIVIVQ